MYKNFNLTESEREQILSMHQAHGYKQPLNESNTNIYKLDLLNEQPVTNINPKNLKFGDRGDDVKALQQILMNKRFLKTTSMKPTGYFGSMTKAALDAANGVKSDPMAAVPKQAALQTSVKSAGFCQPITAKSNISGLRDILAGYQTFAFANNLDPYVAVNNKMNILSKSYLTQGIPQRTACEIALVQIRPTYKDRNAIVVDSLNKLLYVFDKSGKFINMTVIISGMNKQSVDPKVVARALMSWSEEVRSMGFQWVNGKGFVDTTGKNRKYDAEMVYSDTKKNKTAFLPKGIYKTDSKTHGDKDYAGKTNNILSLLNGDKELAQAIHGYYVEQPRTEALKKAQQVLSAPNDPKVSQEFMNMVSNKKVNLSQSYGCINVPENFVPILNKYMLSSYVFNIGEDNQDYLVNNTTNYFEKMQSSQACPSPQSLGAIDVNSIA